MYDTIPKDVNFWLSRGASLVLLRHGIGLKKIERAIDSPDHRLFKLFHGNRLQRFVYGLAMPWHSPIQVSSRPAAKNTPNKRLRTSA
jgi:hypothetical protein